jgi:hypothetical protein
VGYEALTPAKYKMEEADLSVKQTIIVPVIFYGWVGIIS